MPDPMAAPPLSGPRDKWEIFCRLPAGERSPGRAAAQVAHRLSTVIGIRRTVKTAPPWPALARKPDDWHATRLAFGGRHGGREIAQLTGLQGAQAIELSVVAVENPVGGLRRAGRCRAGPRRRSRTRPESVDDSGRGRVAPLVCGLCMFPTPG